MSARPNPAWQTQTGSFRVPEAEMLEWCASLARLETRVDDIAKAQARPLLPAWLWGAIFSALAAAVGSGFKTMLDMATLKAQVAAHMEAHDARQASIAGPRNGG